MTPLETEIREARRRVLEANLEVTDAQRELAFLTGIPSGRTVRIHTGHGAPDFSVRINEELLLDRENWAECVARDIAGPGFTVVPNHRRPSDGDDLTLVKA